MSEARCPSAIIFVTLEQIALPGFLQGPPVSMKHI